MIEAGLRSYLGTSSGLTALIAQGIYPETAPQSAPFPRVVYMVVSSRPLHSLGGAAGFRYARIQLDAHGRGATGYADAKAVEEQLRLILDGYRGDWGGFAVQRCFATESRDGYLPPASSDEYGVDVVSFDIEVGFIETPPSLP